MDKSEMFTAEKLDLLTAEKLDKWLNNNLNVLFIGEHGVGKTSIVTDTFVRNNLKWISFSAATMDPWVDFVGIPKIVKDENGKEFLELVRPKDFLDVEAIFMDELNRSPKKVRNAVMELIQKKSINGKVFPKLRVVWGAINPEDEDKTYDIEKMDPAQIDRFHVHCEIPYKCNNEYFKNKFGQKGLKAIEWWNQLKEIQKEVSPRRLDYALSFYDQGGDIKDILPIKSNTTKLIFMLESESIIKKFRLIHQENNLEEARSILRNENNYAQLESVIISSQTLLEFSWPVLRKEKQLSFGATYIDNIINYANINNNIDSFVMKIISDLYVRLSDSIKDKIKKMLNDRLFKQMTSLESKTQSFNDWENIIHRFKKNTLTTVTRKNGLEYFYKNLPEFIDKETAEAMLDLMEDYASRSHSATIVQEFDTYKYLIIKCYKVIDPTRKIVNNSDLIDIFLGHRHYHNLSRKINFAAKSKINSGIP